MYAAVGFVMKGTISRADYTWYALQEQPGRYTHSMWHVYLLACADTTLYAGVTTDLSRRVAEHNGSPKGAKYTRVRRPVTLAYSESFETRSEACAREAAIKRLSRPEKLALICGT